MNIVFFGTPEFAADILGVLINSEHKVLAAVSQPDRPKGRGGKTVPTPVRAAATAAGIPVLSPESVRDAAFAKVLAGIGAEIFVVAAFGQFFPRRLLDMPARGCVNVHASLLPRYRGASPAAQAIINGDVVTGVSIMKMTVGMDAGPVIYALETPISADDTAGSLLKKLAVTGGEALTRALDLIGCGRALYTPQDDGLATYAPLLTKDMGRIDFTRSADRIVNLVRGLDPWPGAYIEANGVVTKVWRAEPCEKKTDAPPGTLLSAGNAVVMACGGGETVCLTELQAPGGKRLEAAAFLRGRPSPFGIAR